jgi:DnaA family protein
LFEQLRQAGGRLVVSAAAPPGDVRFGLPDLASRLKSGGVYRLQPLDDAGRLAALQIRARFRGFDLPDDTGRYLLNRLARGPASLFRVLDTLDRAALVAQKRLTIPFVRSILEA